MNVWWYGLWAIELRLLLISWFWALDWWLWTLVFWLVGRLLCLCLIRLFFCGI